MVDLTKVTTQVSDKTVMDPSNVCPEETDVPKKWKFKQFTTSQFLDAVRSNLAINANFFLNAEDVHNKKCARPYGLCMHNGDIENPATDLGTEDPQDALRQQYKLNPKGSVDLIVDNTAGTSKIVTDYTAEKYASFKEGVAGNWLIQDGDTLNALLLNPVPTDREARMAVGYKKDTPNILYILAVEKRAQDRSKPGVIEDLKPAESIKTYAPKQVDSGGASLIEMADIMKSLGVDNAVNLDGGGSAGLCYNDGEEGHAVYCMVPGDFFSSDELGRIYKERPSPCQVAFTFKS